jgi:hypothetical protein
MVQVADYIRTPHWSTEIPRETDHVRLDVLAERGFAVLTDLEPPIADEEFLSLEYMDWKSGGDTNFAPIATADGELDCQGFWKPGQERPDKGGMLTSNAPRCPRIVDEVRGVGADFGRVRVIKLEPQTYEESLHHIHRDDNNRFNPEGTGWVVRQWLELTDNPGAFMVLMEQGDDGLPDQSTEVHIPMHKGARFVVDTQRLWHVVCNPSATTRCALIASFESGPALDGWVRTKLPAQRETTPGE